MTDEIQRCQYCEDVIDMTGDEQRFHMLDQSTQEIMIVCEFCAYLDAIATLKEVLSIKPFRVYDIRKIFASDF